MVSSRESMTKTIHKSGTKWFCCGGLKTFVVKLHRYLCLFDQCDQVFSYPMRGDLNWLYVADVAHRDIQVFDHANTLIAMDETNRIMT